MSLTNSIPYFRTVMNTLGHKEWKDAFGDDNIPSTLLDRSYHLLLGETSNVKQNQDLIEVMQPVNINFFVKGFRDTAAGRDLAVSYKEAIIRKALETDRRATTYTGIKNVLFVNSSLTQLSADNDNVIKVSLNFNCYVTLVS